jgi:hypothetical protein
MSPDDAIAKTMTAETFAYEFYSPITYCPLGRHCFSRHTADGQLCVS